MRLGGNRIPLLCAFAVLASAGCSGGDNPVATPPVVTPPPVTNVNINNPTLTRADNNPIRPAGMSVVWADEFDGSQLDSGKWFFESGDGSQYGLNGWGNDELQWYLPDSAELDNGLLVITAREEASNGRDYTSARLHTRDRFAFRYGRIEARIRLPGGQGLWPAFWLLPQDDVYGTWAASGEIDIVEAVNLGVNGSNEIHGTLHYGGEWPDNTFSGNQYVVPSSATDEFHVYAIEWDTGEIRWYVDDVLYAMQNSWTSTGGAFPAPFDQFFYVLLNVAVGGNFPGAPDTSTVFPVTMEVDYIRVYSGDI